MRAGRAAAGAAHLPGRLGGGSAGGNNQSSGNSHARADPGNEPQLHRVQVPAN